MPRLNLAQRIAVVLGWAAALTFFGEWVATLHGYSYGFGSHIYSYGSGGVVNGKHQITIGSPPAQPVYTGLHPWAIMLVWVGLAVVWVASAVWLLRVIALRPTPEGDSAPA